MMEELRQVIYASKAEIPWEKQRAEKLCGRAVERLLGTEPLPKARFAKDACERRDVMGESA